MYISNKVFKSNFRKLKLLFLVLFLFNCNNNDDNNNEPEQETYMCCGENPFASMNVDNLDQSAGELKVVELFTPNGDGMNDSFVVENLYNYSYNSVTLYDLDDNIVYSSENYNGNISWTVFSGIDSGTLKYKLVVENEQTFVEFGYVCMVKEIGDGDEFSFYTECNDIGFDPIIAF